MRKREKIYRHLSKAKALLNTRPNLAIDHAHIVFAMIDENQKVLLREVLLLLVRGYRKVGNFVTSNEILDNLTSLSDLEVNDPITWMGIHHERGVLFMAMQQYEFAMEEFFVALNIAEDMKNIEERIRIINNIGILHTRIDNYDVAISSLMEAYALVIEYQREKDSIYILTNIADVYVELDRMQRAKEKLEQIETLLDTEKDCYRLGQYYNVRAKYESACGNYMESHKYFELAIAIFNDIECEYKKVKIYKSLTDLYEMNDEYEKAYKTNNTNIILAEKNSYRYVLEDLYLKRVNYARKMGNVEEAFLYYERFVVCHQRNENSHNERLKIGIENLYNLRRAKKDKALVQEENSQLMRVMRSLETMINRLKTVQDFSYSITTTLKIDKIVNRIYDNLNDIMNAHAFAIYLYDDKDEVFNYTYLIEGNEELLVSHDRISGDNTFAKHCIQSKETIVIQNAFDFDRVTAKAGIKPNVVAGEFMKSLVFTPMILENNTIGVMTIQSPDENAFLEEDVAIIRTLAGFMASASHNASQAYELEKTISKLNRMSYIDSLTELYNRHALNERSSDTINDGTYTWYAGLMLDLDNFKGINDTYGHLVGDSTLKAVARFIREEVDEVSSRAYRYGGDEFFVELHVDDVNIIDRVARSIIDRIDGMKFDGDCKVTASIGAEIVNAKNHDLKLETIMSVADDLLYEAKNKGKNQLVKRIKA